ncbi:MAG: TonB-dependent receptor [Acidobacteria bacterium]|nr:TonB-dependent receptor [Acidobacteriota bacterium]
MAITEPRHRPGLLAIILLLALAPALATEPTSATELDDTKVDDAALAAAGSEEDGLGTSEKLPTVEDRITVSGGRTLATASPASAAATSIAITEPEAAPATLTEIVSATPAVSQNGQGGLFQVFSIRGVSRERVQTRIAGVRLTSERRAGISASFLDPQLLSAVDVLRGPASSLHGSGALGGVVQLLPARFEGSTVTAGYDSQGDERYAAVGWGEGDAEGRGWSLGLAHRSAGDDESGDGTLRNSAFSQVSAVLRRGWGTGTTRHEIVVIPTYGDDIGKANTDFPRRDTTYPRERHLLARYSLDTEAGTSFQAYLHPQDLEALTVTAGDGRAEVSNKSFDLGAEWQRRWHGGPLDGHWGVEYFGRRGVDATEVDRPEDPTAEVVRAKTLDGGALDEVGVFVAAGHDFGEARLEAGTRFTWQRQDNRGSDSVDDTAWSGFVGLTLPLGSGVELVANVGTGLRFAGLSERYFSGTTGRGEITANPDLDPERSLNVDLGLRRSGRHTFAAVYAFHTRVEDYIERVEVAPDQLGFVNLLSGTIEGVEAEIHWVAGPRFELYGSGHFMRGRAAGGEALADIPPHRLIFGGERRLGRWRLEGRWQYRFAKDDPGSGEQAIDAADVLDAALGYELRTGLELTLRGTNLLDEEYQASADRKDIGARGRSIGLALAWHAR